MKTEDLICQPKEDETQNLNVYEQLVSNCLPVSQERGKFGHFALKVVVKVKNKTRRIESWLMKRSGQHRLFFWGGGKIWKVLSPSWPPQNDPQRAPAPPLCGADSQVSGPMTTSVMLPCVAANSGREVVGIFLLCACVCMCKRDFRTEIPFVLSESNTLSIYQNFFLCLIK